MTAKEIITEKMKKAGWTQKKLAEETGMASQSNITGILNRGNMSMKNLLLITKALGCEVIIREKRYNKDDEVEEWRLDQ